MSKLKKKSDWLKMRIEILQTDQSVLESKKEILQEEITALEERIETFQKDLEEKKDNIKLLGIPPPPEYNSLDYVLFVRQIPMKKAELIPGELTKTKFEEASRRHLMKSNDDQSLKGPNFLKKIIWHVFSYPELSLSVFPKTSDIDSTVVGEIYIFKEMKDDGTPKYNFLSTEEESMNERTLLVPTVPMISLYLLKPQTLGLENTEANSIFLCLLLGRPYINDEVYESFSTLNQLFTNGLLDRKAPEISKETLIKHSKLFEEQLKLHQQTESILIRHLLLLYEYVSKKNEIVLETVHGPIIEHMNRYTKYSYHNILCIHKNEDGYYALVPYDISNYGSVNERFFNNNLQINRMVSRLKSIPPVRRGGISFLEIMLRDKIIFKKKFMENERDFYEKYIYPQIVPSKKVIFSKHYPCEEISQEDLLHLKNNVIWLHMYSETSKELTSFHNYIENPHIKHVYLEDVYIMKKMIGDKPSLSYMSPMMRPTTGKPLLPHLPMISLYLLDPETLGLTAFDTFHTALFLCFILGGKYIRYNKDEDSNFYESFNEIFELNYSTITKDVLKSTLYSGYKKFATGPNHIILNEFIKKGQIIVYVYKTINGKIVCNEIIGDFASHQRNYPDCYTNILCVHEHRGGFDALVPYDEANCSPDINKHFFKNNLDENEIVYNLNRNGCLKISHEEIEHGNKEFIEKLSNSLKAVDAPQKEFLESVFDLDKLNPKV